jgi:hypothetical protein
MQSINGLQEAQRGCKFEALAIHAGSRQAGQRAGHPEHFLDSQDPQVRDKGSANQISKKTDPPLQAEPTELHS